jgi:hypothetical protein
VPIAGILKIIKSIYLAINLALKRKVAPTIKTIRETKTQLGSTTGALETFMLSAICPKLIYCVKNDIVYDGGNDEDEFCPIPGSDTKDGGNELTDVCCPQKDVIYDGGNEQNEFCPIPGSDIKDGGNELTKVCGI